MTENLLPPSAPNYNLMCNIFLLHQQLAQRKYVEFIYQIWKTENLAKVKDYHF